MSGLRLATAVCGGLIFLFAGADTFAATRNCTAEEKKLADVRLKEIAADTDLRGALLRQHLRFGVHEAVGHAANEEILVQGGYVMNHDRDLLTALWVSYLLTAQDLTDAAGKDRVNCFRPDPRMKAADTADPSDYNEPRYDQGHMTNDADLKDDVIEQINSYVMSNMSPQECRFNRGIWLSLEHLARAWASKYGTLYITSGAIFDRNNDLRRDDDSKARRMKSRNGKKRVGVPSHYYKIFLRQDGDGFRSIAFLLTHTNRRHGVKWVDVRPDVQRTIVTIARIEDKADLRIHPQLQRNRVTQSAAGEDWDFSPGKSNLEAGCD